MSWQTRNSLLWSIHNTSSGQTNVGNFNLVPTQTNQAASDTIASNAFKYINFSGHTQLRIHFQQVTNNTYQMDVMDFYSGDSGGAYVPVLKRSRQQIFFCCLDPILAN